MFHILFKRPSAVARHQTRPLSEERLRYLNYLAEQGASRGTLQGVARYLLVIIDYLGLAERTSGCICRAEIEEKASRWSHRSPKPPKGNRCSWARFVMIATRWIQFMGRLQQPTPKPNPYANTIGAFADYMLDERGLSPETIHYRCWAMQDFLSRLGVPLSKITTRHIDETLLEKVTRSGYSRASVQTYAGALRAFLRFAETRNWCRAGLAGAIQAPRVFPQESLPSGPSWDQVQGLIAACRGDRPADVRNRALLMLLATYGLRAGEVVDLQLKNFDWQRELLTVKHSKNQRVQTRPLCQSVGNAVLRYLQQVRPRTPHREVFLTLRAPFQPLSRAALTAMVTRKLKALDVSLSHYGPHALRHTCATHLLQMGLSLKEIGNHLGHQCPDATRIYAKVDIVGLREVADFDLGDLI